MAANERLRRALIEAGVDQGELADHVAIDPKTALEHRGTPYLG